MIGASLEHQKYDYKILNKIKHLYIFVNLGLMMLMGVYPW